MAGPEEIALQRPHVQPNLEGDETLVVAQARLSDFQSRKKIHQSRANRCRWAHNLLIYHSVNDNNRCGLD